MTWYFGFHLKWRTAKKFATRRGIKVPRWEFLAFKVHRQIQADSGVDFWISHDRQDRIIITFFENETERDTAGIKFSVGEIVRVMKVMRLKHAPRWYSDSPADVVYEEESSDDDEIDAGNISGSERPAWLQRPPSPDESDSDSDSDSDSHSNEDISESETETEGVGKEKANFKAGKGKDGGSVGNVRKGVQAMTI